MMELIDKSEEYQLLSGKVLQIVAWNSATEILMSEATIVEKYQPHYMFCAINSHDIATIQELENQGFGFSEFRVHSNLLLDNKSVHSNIYPYQVELVGNAKDLETIKEMMVANFPDDRFYNDPLFDKDVARKRELNNIIKSFNSLPKGFILGLFNVQTKKLIGFRSGAFKSKNEVDYYLHGIDKKFDQEHYARILDNGCIYFLKNRDVRVIHSVSTGFNILEINRLIKYHGFKIENTEVILRKVYS